MAGIVLPQLAPASEDRVSGAQVIDGGLRFDHGSNQYLKRTPINAGDTNVWTWSAWVKKSNATEQFAMFSVYGAGSNAGYGMLWFQNDGTLYFHNWDGQNNSAQTNAKFRNNGWYHIVAVHNEANDTKMKFYVNGTLQTLAYNLTTSTGVNSAAEHRIGMEVYNSRKPYEGNMAQVYLIDGLELGPEHFGYTDPLTDTWRPKKYSFSKKSLNATVSSWDSYFTTSGSWTNPANLFDGSLGYGSGGETQVRDGANNNPALDVTIPVSSVGSTPQEVTIAAKMYLDSYAGANPNASTNGFVRVIATIDGTDVTKEYTDATAPNSAGTFNGRYHQDFGSFGTGVVSRVRITTQAAWFHVAGLEVNGTVLQNSIVGDNTFYLPFDGNSPIGQDQAPSPNDGTVWSSGWSGTNMSGYNKEESFDGITNTNGNNATRVEVNQTLTWTNPKTSTPFTTLRLWAADDGSTIRVNGVDVSSQVGTGYAGIQFFTITGVGSALETIELVGGSGVAPMLWAVEVDGSILIDGQIGNSWTPVNFGGSAALDKATGARPILNTVNGGTKAAPGVFGSQVNRDFTILGTSGGGLYRFEGISGTNPPLSFVRGATYIFDYSATSGSHPLAFSTTDPDSSTTAYTDGVNTATSNVTKITVPHDAPDTLYYYCTSHSNMNNAITVTTDETKADPYAWKNVLAMPLAGNGADSSGQINCTTSTKAITTGGSPAVDTDSNFYHSAIDFTASSTTGYYPTGAQSDFAFGTNDFTIEFWFKPTTTSRQYITDFRNNGSGSGSGNNKPFVIFADNGSDGTGSQIRYANDTSSPNIDLLGGVGLPPSNTWHHLAIVRSSGTVYGYLNGVLHNSATDNTNYSTNDSVTVGNSSGVSLNFDGSIQDYRVYKGVAKYTSNFIPASTNPDILRDSPSGAAFKSQLTTITDGATAFDGSGDYLRVEHGDMAMGTGDFAVEAFIYNNSHTNYRNYIGTRESGQAVNEGWCIASNAGGALYVYSNGLYTNLTTEMAVDRWYHVVYTRASGTHRWIVDGVLRGTDSSSRDYTDDKLTIGANSYAGSEPLDGFVSNVRVIKGSIPTEYQTSSTTTGEKIFIPPSEPLTTTSQGATANDVKLLCCQSNTSATAAAVTPTAAAALNLPLSSTPFADSSATSAAITNTGSITTTSAGTNSFNITNAASLDGSSQRITTNNTNISFQNRWTVDIYFKLDSSASAYNALINSGYGSQTSNYLYIGINDDEKPYIETSSSGSATTATNAISKNVWYHGRVTQDGSTITFYINGESFVTKTAQTTDLSSAGSFTIGSFLDNANNVNNFHGLIGPVRVFNSNIGAPASGGEATSSGTLSNSASVVLDVFGDAAATNFNPLTDDINTVLGQEGVYAVMNPLGKGSNVTLSRNNLRAVSGSSGDSNRAGYCNMAVPASGSYYCEATIGATNGMVGIINADYFRLDNIPGCVPNSYAYYENGNKYLGDCNAASYGASFTTGDVIGMGIDRGTLTFYKNGVSQGPAMENLDGRYFFGFGSYNNTIDFNFGQKPFKFAPPRGHQPITSSTIRETSQDPRPNKYCAPMIWTGSSLNVSESRTITTERADFIPDLVWVKTRTGGNEPPAVYDSVRGDGTGNKRLLSDRTNAESTFSSGVSADLSGFVKGGFTVNGTNGHINGGTSYTHAAWMWKAGGKHNTFNIDDVGYANASDVNMSVGSLNSTMLRQDANYANSSNFSEDTSGLTFTRMFNGTMGSGDVTASVCLFSPYGNNLVTTWTAPTTITNITKLRIYVDMSGTASGGAFEVNGVDYRDYLDSAIYGQITSGEDGWVTIPETHLSTIRFGRNSNNTIAIGICAVEVNDQILIDNQITAPNFPSIANDGCSVGTKNGFSIVTYTGNGGAAQLAHGLGGYPDFILHKFRTAGSNWSAWSPFLNNNTRVIWNDNDGMASSSSFNQNTKHTFNVHSGHNDNNVQMIAYCWRNIPGVQKFGQYQGTGSDLGAYIDCGFKPAIVITKAYSTNSTNNNDWIVKDTARDTYNPTTKNLLMNKTDQELSSASHASIDITENGFKLYNDDSGYSNYSGGAGTWDYIYMAFAEQPAFNLYGALSNTR